MRTLGLDLGGASLKAAAGLGRSAALKFALWRDPDGLPEALARLAAPFSPRRIAVTMTGELCDCFIDKAEGVDRILDAVERVFHGKEIWVWQTSGRFVSPAMARRQSWETASANWLALARWSARLAPAGFVLLIDVGSTTTDITPILHGQPVPLGRTDPDRLATGELVYVGVERTPIAALLEQVTLAGRSHGVMAELFATSLDGFLVLEKIAEDPQFTATADGRPATKEAARQRLARMIGSDRSRFSPVLALELAQQMSAALGRRIRHGLNGVLARFASPPDQIILAGQGEFLAKQLLVEHPLLRQTTMIELRERLDPATSVSACAYAVAELLDELPPIMPDA